MDGQIVKTPCRETKRIIGRRVKADESRALAFGYVSQGRHAQRHGQIQGADRDLFNVLGVALLKIVQQGPAFFSGKGFQHATQRGFPRRALQGLRRHGGVGRAYRIQAFKRGQLLFRCPVAENMHVHMAAAFKGPQGSDHDVNSLQRDIRRRGKKVFFHIFPC